MALAYTQVMKPVYLILLVLLALGCSHDAKRENPLDPNAGGAGRCAGFDYRHGRTFERIASEFREQVQKNAVNIDACFYDIVLAHQAQGQRETETLELSLSVNDSADRHRTRFDRRPALRIETLGVERRKFLAHYYMGAIPCRHPDARYRTRVNALPAFLLQDDLRKQYFGDAELPVVRK